VFPTFLNPAERELLRKRKEAQPAPVGSIVCIDIRVPRQSDLYIDKTGKLKQCRSQQYSNKARERWIVEFRLYGQAPPYVKAAKP
jgi:hypothetical protein